MHIITERDVIKTVCVRWRKQYPDDERRVGFGTGTVGGIWTRLRALDLASCTRKDVDDALGVTGWADAKCDICHEPKPRVLRLGDEPDYDARWIDICDDCLAEAAAVMMLVETV